MLFLRKIDGVFRVAHVFRHLAGNFFAEGKVGLDVGRVATVAMVPNFFVINPFAKGRVPGS